MNGRQKQTLATLAVFATAGAITAVAMKAIRASKGKKRDELHERWDAVDLYIEESFPASDAPGYSPTARIGGIR